MLRGYKIRIYPTVEQEKLIWEHINASRFIWNYMLDYQEKHYRETGSHLRAYALCLMLKDIKRKNEYSWLKRVSNATLKCVCQDLDAAYGNYFRGANLPKFKSKKKAKTAFPVRSDVLRFDSKYVIIEKLKSVKYKTDYNIPIGKGIKFYNVRLSYCNGKYYLSFSMEYENQVFDLTDKRVGIDLGIKELAVVACEQDIYVFHNINKTKKIRNIDKKINATQRRISKKRRIAKSKGEVAENGKNIMKEIVKLNKLYSKKKNINGNYIHQITHMLVSLLPSVVVMEDLNVSGMLKNRHLSRAVQEQCFYKFIRTMKYKCVQRGIKFVQADRFYPSSKTCSCCGAIKKDLKLSDRTYVCNECGFKIDRDANAALNLMKYVDY